MAGDSVVHRPPRKPAPRRAPLAAAPVPLIAALLTAALAVAVLLAGCGPSPATTQTTQTTQGNPTGRPTQAMPGRTPAQSPAAGAGPHRTGSPSALPVAPGAGALPQTRAFPSTSSAAFGHAMTDLWLAVTTGNPRLGLPAFFPVAAYDQVKAIANPAADWRARLWGDFVLDVGAAHRVVPKGARLVRVIVPVADAAWIPPRACYNSIGYWHVPGARVVYREHGQERSFGIASLISWRGVWYVVHFGAVLRGAATGIVDDPAVGPGTPGPPGGC